MYLFFLFDLIEVDETRLEQTLCILKLINIIKWSSFNSYQLSNNNNNNNIQEALFHFVLKWKILSYLHFLFLFVTFLNVSTWHLNLQPH